MAGQSHQVKATWQEEDFAKTWAQRDAIRGMLDFPRRIAAAVVADDNPGLDHVVDIGSGPGDFLAAFLEEFPAAHGVWTDVSEAMLGLARERLAGLGDRVEYHLVDMTDLAAIPDGVGLISTSRAAHHLNRGALLDFYTQASSHLAPGGWLVNLDHIGLDSSNGPWDARLRSARKVFRAPVDNSGDQQHHHDHPLPTAQDHLDGYAAAGISDVQVVWRAFYTCLFMGRRGT
jgi:SAM-dependent methyltransferase